MVFLELDEVREKARQLTQSTLRCFDVAKDLLRRVDAIDSEARALLQELEGAQGGHR